jgi:hypothetical protein
VARESYGVLSAENSPQLSSALMNLENYVQKKKKIGKLCPKVGLSIRVGDAAVALLSIKTSVETIG